MGIYDIDALGDLLAANTYPGRGLVVGKTADGKKAAIAYFIMGRSENSRNRVFVEQGDEVVIHPFDPSKVANPSLIIYSPIKTYKNNLIVTNGDQTDTIYDFLIDGKTFEEALDTRCFEPDGPNFTPRISSLLTFADGDFTYKLNILKSADAEGSACNRYTFSYSPLSGLGHFIHTYNCDGNPIPAFTGEPERVAVPGSIDEFTNAIWNHLNGQNKVSLYVRFVNLADSKTENRMMNKNK
ncbi:MAG: IMP cyclohydrolase [Deltaproteobacteria bacterium]|nr:IMP cyclohydrolase [Deltaproteobacteria bacterium]